MRIGHAEGAQQPHDVEMPEMGVKDDANQPGGEATELGQRGIGIAGGVWLELQGRQKDGGRFEDMLLLKNLCGPVVSEKVIGEDFGVSNEAMIFNDFFCYQLMQTVIYAN